MGVLELAAAIVLAVLVLAFWDVILVGVLALVGIAVVAALVIGGGFVAFAPNSPAAPTSAPPAPMPTPPSSDAHSTHRDQSVRGIVIAQSTPS
jgi:hypothetical protein